MRYFELTPISQRLRTPECDLLGIDLPVFQTGMGFISRSALAGAVSQADGGVHYRRISCAMMVRWICEVPPPTVDCMPSRK